MLHVEKWAQDKPLIIAMPAINLVTFADCMYEALPQAKERRLFGRVFLPPDDFHVWHQMYQSPFRPVRAFIKMLNDFDENGPLIVFLIRAGRWFQRILKRNPNYFRDNPPTVEDIRQAIEFQRELNAMFFADIKDELDPHPNSPDEQSRIDKYIEEHKQELGFVFFVIMPSVMIFQTSPYILYRQAITGDIGSIEKLLKLDPLLLTDPGIYKHIQNLRFTNKINDYERVTAAIHKFAATDYSEVDDARKNSKVQLAAIIQALSLFAGKRLTATKIAKLFNAYSNDKQRGDTDFDIPEGESFSKAIKRHIDPWINLLQIPDKKK